MTRETFGEAREAAWERRHAARDARIAGEAAERVRLEAEEAARFARAQSVDASTVVDAQRVLVGRGTVPADLDDAARSGWIDPDTAAARDRWQAEAVARIAAAGRDAQSVHAGTGAGDADQAAADAQPVHAEHRGTRTGAPTVYRLSARAALVLADVLTRPGAPWHGWHAPAGSPTAPHYEPGAPCGPWQPLDRSARPELAAARRLLAPVDVVLDVDRPEELPGARIAGEELAPRPAPDADPYRPGPWRVPADVLAAAWPALRHLPEWDRGPTTSARTWSDVRPEPVRTDPADGPHPAAPEEPRDRLADLAAAALGRFTGPDPLSGPRTAPSDPADTGTPWSRATGRTVTTTVAELLANAARRAEHVDPFSGIIPPPVREPITHHTTSGARFAAGAFTPAPQDVDRLAARVLDAGRWHRHTYAARWLPDLAGLPALPVPSSFADLAGEESRTVRGGIHYGAQEPQDGPQDTAGPPCLTGCHPRALHGTGRHWPTCPNGPQEAPQDEAPQDVERCPLRPWADCVPGYSDPAECRAVCQRAADVLATRGPITGRPLDVIRARNRADLDAGPQEAPQERPAWLVDVREPIPPDALPQDGPTGAPCPLDPAAGPCRCGPGSVRCRVPGEPPAGPFPPDASELHPAGETPPESAGRLASPQVSPGIEPPAAPLDAHTAHAPTRQDEAPHGWIRAQLAAAAARSAALPPWARPTVTRPAHITQTRPDAHPMHAFTGHRIPWHQLPPITTPRGGIRYGATNRPQEAPPVPDHTDDPADCPACQDGPQEDPAGPCCRAAEIRGTSCAAIRADGPQEADPWTDPAPLYQIPPGHRVHWRRGAPYAAPLTEPIPEDAHEPLGPAWRRATRAAVLAWATSDPYPGPATEDDEDGSQEAPQERVTVHRTWTGRDALRATYRPPSDAQRARDAAARATQEPRAVQTGPEHPCPEAGGAPCTLIPGTFGCCADVDVLDDAQDDQDRPELHGDPPQERPQEARRGPACHPDTCRRPDRPCTGPCGAVPPTLAAGGLITGRLTTTLRLGTGRVWIAPHPGPLDVDPPAPGTEGNPWRDVGGLLPGGLSFDLGEGAGDLDQLHETARTWSLTTASVSVSFDTPGPAWRLLWRVIEQHRAQATRAHSGRVMRALRRRAARIRRGRRGAR